MQEKNSNINFFDRCKIPNIRFYIQDVHGRSYLYIVFNFNKRRIRTSLSLEVNKHFWDKNKQRLKRTDPHSATINNFLDNLEDAVINYCIDLINNKIDFVETTHLKKLIVQTKGVPSSTQATIEDLFYNFIEDSKSGNRRNINGRLLQSATIKSYQSTYNLLKRFQTECAFNINANHIGKEFYNSFRDFCSQSDMKINSFGKHIKIIKSMLNYSYDCNLIDNKNYSKVLIIPTASADEVYLTEEELGRIGSLKGLSEDERKAKDLFMIQSWTGLRFEDANNLNSSSINLEDNTISLITMKTNERVTLPILPHIRGIIRNCIYNNSFPTFSNAVYNKYLKEIAKRANITNLITVESALLSGNELVQKQRFEMVKSHTGRRSFITNLIKRGVSIDVVKKLSGHRSDKHFNKYIRRTKLEACEEVQKIYEPNEQGYRDANIIRFVG